MNPSKTVHIGEILVPGAARLHGARTFMLTAPAQGHSAEVELLFGVFAAEAQKKIVEKLCDRLVEELRPAFFRDGLEADVRYEATLKHANRVILSFLHEHGLSLPGLKLRGALGALSGDRLLVSNRGSFRGYLSIPNTDHFEVFRLFDETPESSTSPKFFSSLQAGVIQPGTRMYVTSTELFRTLDEAYAERLLSGTDSELITKTLKNALKSTDLPVSMLTLETPIPESFAFGKPQTPNPKPQTNNKPQNRKPRPEDAPVLAPAGTDVGQLVAKGVYAVLAFAVAGLRRLPELGTALGRGILFIARQVPGAIQSVLSLFRPAARQLAMAEATSFHERLIDRGIARLNAVPEHRRWHFLLTFLAVNMVVHGVFAGVRNQVLASEVKAYEARLAEFQQLQTDLETSMIYGNDERSKELYLRLEIIALGLPEKTPAQKKTKLSAMEALEVSQKFLRRVVDIEAPAPFASFEDADGRFRDGPAAYFKGAVYVFSKTAPEVIAIGSDGTAAPPVTLRGASVGAVDAVAATTGLLILGADGTVRFWNPSSDTATQYADAIINRGPIMFWQGRLYDAAPDASIVRRPVLDGKFGPAVAAAASAPGISIVSGIAADGALFVLSPAGTVKKFLKGSEVREFHAPTVDPAPSDAVDLWASPASPWLVFAERGGERVFLADKISGRLGGQLTSQSFGPISSIAVDDNGKDIYILSGSRMFKIPLTIAATK